MKKIITAIGNPLLNKKIKQIEDCKILSNDITNDEELIECLQREHDIDYLFLSNKIIKNYKVDEFIKIIRKLQENIYIIFFKYRGIELNFIENEKLKIYDKIEMDLTELKELLSISTNKVNNNSKIIAVAGASGIGKSTFSTFFAKSVENSKVLLIDFDLEQNQSRTLFKIKKYPEFDGNIENLIININKNLDILCQLDFVFSEKNPVDFIKIQEMLNKFRQKYNLIIIDTSSNLKNEYTKRIFYNSDNIIFLLEPNILGVKKSKNILEVLESDWKIDKSKINLILNKTNIYQISDSIIEELFPDLKLMGKLKYNDTYNLIINKNINKKEIKKEYEKIYKKLEI